MQTLDDLMLSIRHMGEEDQPALSEDPVDLLLYAPCPVKLSIKYHIDRILEDLAAKGLTATAHIPMGSYNFV